MRITANKIDEWANTTDCRNKLPLLIRKLIYESINDISKCKFPYLEQTTSSSGFDGVLESNEETQYRRCSNFKSMVGKMEFCDPQYAIFFKISFNT